MNSLDEEVRQLLHEGKNVEAVLLVHKSKGCTLAEAKKYIDKLKDDDCNWKNPHNNRGWNIEYKDGRVEHITYKDDRDTYSYTWQSRMDCYPHGGYSDRQWKVQPYRV